MFVYSESFFSLFLWQNLGERHTWAWRDIRGKRQDRHFIPYIHVRASSFPSFTSYFLPHPLFFPPSSSPASSFAFNMPSILQRHPRYSLLSGFLLLATFLLLASQHAPPPPAFIINAGGQESLDERLDRAESIYQRVLRDRQGLIERFGPTPDKVMM